MTGDLAARNSLACHLSAYFSRYPLGCVAARFIHALNGTCDTLTVARSYLRGVPLSGTLSRMQSPYNRSVAAEIRAELGRKCLSQRQLAMMLGTTPQWVARRLSVPETVALSTEDLEHIARVLGTSPSQFANAKYAA